MGSILAALDDAGGGIAHSTFVLLTADHGVHLGEKAVAVGSKWTLWEQTSRVPLMIFDPRRPARSRGSTVGAAVSLVDILPTLAEVGGVALPSASSRPLAGASLLAHLADGGGGGAAVAALRHRVVLVTSHCPGRTLLGYAVRGARWRYISYASRTTGGPAGKPWPSLEAAADAGNELYDALADPHERVNLLQAQRGWNASAREQVRWHWAAMERALQRLLSKNAD